MSNTSITIIETEEHERLCADMATLWFMVRTILNTAKLSYNKENLTFDDETVGALVKAVDKTGYEIKLEELQKKEAE